MIAHISDSPLNYMETLTTVQLASRIHRTRKKQSKNASSSSGGDSSCEEGPSHRPPHPRPLHPKIVALAPDTPLLLSSDPDYSSSSEHSCDTVIYVGPAGAAISDRELSDGEGPPSFVRIVPSLNKQRVKGARRPDRGHLKCNTFAELQEKLDCIAAPAPLSTEAHADPAVLLIRAGATSPPTEGMSSPVFSESTTPTQLPSAGRLLEASKRPGAGGERRADAPFGSCVVQRGGGFPWDSGVREKTFFRGGVPKPSASPSLPRTSREAFQPAEVVGTTPPVGMSQKAPRQGQPLGSPSMERAHRLRAALLGRGLDGDALRTTVTQPVALNGEDELVFTFVEELPLGLIPSSSRPSSGRPSSGLPSSSRPSSGRPSSGLPSSGLPSSGLPSSGLPSSGRPSSPLSFRDCPLQAARPVSIISSINDEYDAYTCLRGAVAPGEDAVGPGEDAVRPGEDAGTGTLSPHDGRDSTAVPWPGEGSAGSAGSSTSRLLLSSRVAPRCLPALCAAGFSRAATLQPGSLNDSGVCFSELDSDPAECPPSTKASLQGRASTLNPSGSERMPRHAAHSSLPRKTKPTSPTAGGCRRQGGGLCESLLQGGGPFAPTGLPSEGQPPGSTVSCKRPGGSSGPRPPKAHVFSSAHRAGDGCEKSSSRRGEALVRLPRLTRDATVSVPQTSTSRWGHEGPSLTGTLRFLSLRKKSNCQKSNMFFKSGSGNISPTAPPGRPSSQELQTGEAHCECEKSLFPNTSDEELSPRLRSESFSHSRLNTEHGPARMSSSLKTRGAKAEASRYYGGLVSLARGAGLHCAGSRQNRSATLGGDSRPHRARVPASAPSPGFSTTLGQLKGNGSPRAAAASGGTRAHTLSASKRPARSGDGARTGKGTIMGTKQALSQAASSRVSELATASQRQPLSRGPEVTGSDVTDGGTSSVSGSPNNSPLPSPYSKVTAPRRPPRRSSVLSGELPPARGRTALLCHRGGSSGYESMMRDSETTGSDSSTHDSVSEGGVSTSNGSRASTSPRKRGHGFLRRRLTPAPRSLDRGQWGTMWEPFEIKVYEIDEMQRHQRSSEAEPLHHVEKGLIYFTGRLRMLERRQEQIGELSSKHQQLKEELEEAKSRLSVPPARWTAAEFEVDQDLDRGSQEFLEALLRDHRGPAGLCQPLQGVGEEAAV
ncbi:hypothetical protein CesoFtcFv8_022646 [Champsocephalus esox]|uniref:Kinesin motor domain-containing protein n=1 Tax=Champsocephalus esox TaxID=159716 RepID=A0AAN8B7B4_9TELE|nr:hypothetical protein CesoFtcFv8_022646 [Champsocephalus esox]